MAAKLEKTRTPGIYRRGSRYAVLYRDSEGRQRQESARTLDEARRLKAARSAAVATGEFHAASRVKLREYALEWVERYQGRGRRGFRESTRDDYRRDMHRYVLPYFDEKLRRRVEQVSPRDVAAFVGWLCDQEEQGRRVAVERRAAKAKKRDVSPSTLPLEPESVHLADATVRRILSPLRACMASAVAEGVVRSNPTIGIALPARDEQRAIDEGTDDDEKNVKALSTSEFAAFMLVCPVRWQTFFRLLAATGLRVSEAFALRWRDLELDGSRAHVRVRRAYVRGRFGPPKSKYGKRSVPIDHALVAELRARRKDAEWAENDDLVFPATNGEPLRQENVRRRALNPAAEEAGVPWAGFHTFRHSCATRLFAAGRNAVQVQRWLGHHSPAFTLSVYVDLLDGDLGEPLASAPAAPVEVVSGPEPVAVAAAA
ncbi:MAG TPA: tyrosine-type recombinase/integrase [Solirubrobacterales bacterium]|nr:tyrosine-type recombinase/integrase [Solirubrobacterales bacterium]